MSMPIWYQTCGFTGVGQRTEENFSSFGIDLRQVSQSVRIVSNLHSHILPVHNSMSILFFALFYHD